MIMRIMNSMAVGRPRVIASVFSVAQSGRAIVVTIVQNKPFIAVTSFLDDIPGGAIGTAFLEHGMQTSQSLRTLFVPASPGSRAGLLLLSIRERIGGREFRNNPLCSRTL
jgi:hypothetical protein